MARFELAAPVEAIQYQRQTNEADVAKLVKGDSGVSWDASRGYLHFYNDGLELAVYPGQWVVWIGDGMMSISNAEFNRLFPRGRLATAHSLREKWRRCVALTRQ